MIVLILLQLPFTAKKGEVCKVLIPTRALRAQAREYERQIVREGSPQGSRQRQEAQRPDGKENEEDQEE